MLRWYGDVAWHGRNAWCARHHPVRRLVVDAFKRAVPAVAFIVVRVAARLRTDGNPVVAQTLLQQAQAVNARLLHVRTPPVPAFRELRKLHVREVEHVRVEEATHDGIGLESDDGGAACSKLLARLMVVQPKGEYVAVLTVEHEEDQIAVYLGIVGQQLAASALAVAEGADFKVWHSLFHALDLDDARDGHVAGKLVHVDVPVVGVGVRRIVLRDVEELFPVRCRAVGFA